MPSRMNCLHSETGWCLACVAALDDQRANAERMVADFCTEVEREVARIDGQPLGAQGWFLAPALHLSQNKDNLIINDKGDNVAPQKVEGMLTLQPEIGQAMIAGDRRPYRTGSPGR